MWNEVVGEAWARHSEEYDATLAPFGAAAMEVLDLRPEHRVLDVACGTGATTIDLGQRVGAGFVLGLDLSRPMLDQAVARLARLEPAPPVRFALADVQSDPIPDGPFDRAFSRFGVMFFSDPVVAFGRIRSALVDDGRLAFVCFQEPGANPFIVGPLLAVSEVLRLPPLPAGDAPGPFSLAQRERTERILEAAGFAEVGVSPGPDHAVMYGADIDGVARRLLEQNPMTGPALRTASPQDQAAAVAAVVEVLSPHVDGDAVTMDASTWLVTARCG